MKNSFPKSKYSLKSKNHINLLFETGKFINNYPFRVLYVFQKETTGDIKLLISVPKKRIKHSVHRNIVKRRIKEVFRHHKTKLESIIKQNNFSIQIAIVYTSSEIINSLIIEEKLIHSLDKLSIILNEYN